VVITRQQRLNNLVLNTIPKKTNTVEVLDFQAIKDFLKGQIREILQEPPLDHPPMEDAPLYDLLGDEKDDLY